MTMTMEDENINVHLSMSMSMPLGYFRLSGNRDRLWTTAYCPPPTPISRSTSKPEMDQDGVKRDRSQDPNWGPVAWCLDQVASGGPCLVITMSMSSSTLNFATAETLSSISTADLRYHNQSKKWVQRPPNKSKVVFVPIDLSVSWESLAEFKVAVPKQEGRNKSPTFQTEGVADTGCTVLCGGPDMMRKLKIPRTKAVLDGLEEPGPPIHHYIILCFRSMFIYT